MAYKHVHITLGLDFTAVFKVQLNKSQELIDHLVTATDPKSACRALSMLMRSELMHRKAEKGDDAQALIDRLKEWYPEIDDHLVPDGSHGFLLTQVSYTPTPQPKDSAEYVSADFRINQ